MMNDENAPPAEEGGMAKGLVKTVSANQMGVSFLSTEWQTAMEEAMRNHERQVEQADGLELVEAWEAYLSWKETHPEETVEAQSTGLRKLLERCIVAFAVSRQRDADGQLLRQSLRALIVVITHVDACGDQDAGAVFEMLWTQGVGIGRSLLYEGWAVIRERSKNYEAAEEIFQLGLRNATKACEETFEATLRKGLRELTQRRRKRGASGGQGAPEAKRARKRVEKKGYMQNLLATDNGDEMCFEEWRVLEHTVLRAPSAQPAASPAQPEASPGNNATMSVDITQLMPSPVPSPQPAAPAASGFSIFVDEPATAVVAPAESALSPAAASPAAASPAAASPTAASFAAAPTPSPVQQAVADVTPTQIYGAETEKLTARDVFSSLQTPPEAMGENLSVILDAIECSEEHARSLCDSLLVNKRLALVSTEILRIACDQGAGELRMLLFVLLNSLVKLAAAQSSDAQPLSCLTGDEATGILTHAQTLVSQGSLQEEDALQLLEALQQLVRLGTTVDPEQGAALLNSLLEYVNDPFASDCVAACRFALLLYSVLPKDAGMPPLAILLTTHDNHRKLGETLLRAFNFAGGEDIPLVLAVLAEIFGSSTTADFFFPNDQKSMIDVLIRNLEDAPGYSPSLRKTFMQVISGIVTNSSDYDKHRHRQEHLIAALQKIAESENMDGATRAFSRDICLSLGGRCTYTGKLGMDY